MSIVYKVKRYMKDIAVKIVYVYKIGDINWQRVLSHLPMQHETVKLKVGVMSIATLKKFLFFFFHKE